MSSDQGDERHGINREIRVRKPRSSYPTSSFPFQVSGPEVYFATTSTSKKWVNKKKLFLDWGKRGKIDGGGSSGKKSLRREEGAAFSSSGASLQNSRYSARAEARGRGRKGEAEAKRKTCWDGGMEERGKWVRLKENDERATRK